MKIEKLYAHIAQNRLTMESLAAVADIDRCTLYRRLNRNGESFTVQEIKALAKQLALSDAEILDIFFTA
ncbi:MAG: hypothetical protein KBG54_00520 [Oscillospiraceae bacterium]|jgi:hypothetical protein|nr:hypothetical protein [Oscillospiraceae bacterium]